LVSVDNDLSYLTYPQYRKLCHTVGHILKFYLDCNCRFRIIAYHSDISYVCVEVYKPYSFKMGIQLKKGVEDQC